MSKRAEEIVSLLKRNIWRFYSEARLHEAISQVLLEADISFTHEYHLGPIGRIDFFCEVDRIGIECKVKGTEAAAMRQLSRYTESEEIDELIVVTTKMRHRFPAELGGKPLHSCRLMGSLC